VKQMYETVIIFDGTLSEDTIRKENEKIEEFFKVNTEFEKTEVWGKRSLAYMINKKRSGVYHLYLYQTQSETNIANKIEKLLKLNESVIRHLTVVREIQKNVERRNITEMPVVEATDEGEE
jgi:small subunit ribosomal protein S6